MPLKHYNSDGALLRAEGPTLLTVASSVEIYTAAGWKSYLDAADALQSSVELTPAEADALKSGLDAHYSQTGGAA